MTLTVVHSSGQDFLFEMSPASGQEKHVGSWLALGRQDCPGNQALQKTGLERLMVKFWEAWILDGMLRRHFASSAKGSKNRDCE